MKKLLSLILLATLLIGCSSDDPADIQGYTSFVFEQTVDVELPNCIAAYKKDGIYYKLGDLGNLSKGKRSPEIRVTDNSITEVYFFTDYNGTVRADVEFKIFPYKKNILVIPSGVKGIGVNKSDPTQYPQ